MNVHFHVIWLDGVYSHEPGRGGVEWCGHAQVTDADVALLVRRVRNRVRRKLRQMGKWPEDGDPVDADVGGDPSDGEQLLLELDAAAVQGVALSGERAGQRDVRVGRGTRNEPFVKGRIGSSRCGRRHGVSISPSISPSQEGANPQSVAPLPGHFSRFRGQRAARSTRGPDLRRPPTSSRTPPCPFLGRRSSCRRQLRRMERQLHRAKYLLDG